MKYHHSLNSSIISILIHSFLILLGFLCLAPLIHIVAVSLSASWAAEAGVVTFWPVGFTTQSYGFVLSRPQFIRSFWITIQRILLGVSINMFLTVLAAYPLSKNNNVFRFRTVYAWIFIFTILFSGGLIPLFVTISRLGLIDSMWALVLPGAVPVFNIIILLNFFRNLPPELEEAAFVDGASHWQILFMIFIPLSKAALATLFLFSFVGHWNSWFDGLIYMNTSENYPLASYLQTVIIGRDLARMTTDEIQMVAMVSSRTIRAAQIFLGVLPVLLLYPFLQRHFQKGIVLGSVKG